MSKATRLDVFALSIPANPNNVRSDMTQQQIRDAVALITDTLRKSLPDVERATLNSERRDLRARLAEIEGMATAAASPRGAKA